MQAEWGAQKKLFVSLYCGSLPSGLGFCASSALNSPKRMARKVGARAINEETKVAKLLTLLLHAVSPSDRFVLVVCICPHAGDWGFCGSTVNRPCARLEDS